MQFTPDVMPSDITGFSIFQKDKNEFVYQPGPIMCNLFLADEINRYLTEDPVGSSGGNGGG